MKLFIFSLSVLFLQSCMYLLYGSSDYSATCMHQKPEFCTKFRAAYKKDWIDRQKFADTRQYFGNFNLFNQIGTTLSSTFNPIPDGKNGENWKNPEFRFFVYVQN